MMLTAIPIGQIAKYLLIAYIVVLTLYKLGKFTYFSIESAKSDKWKSAFHYAVLAALILIIAWICLSPFGVDFGPMPPLTDTAAFKWIAYGSVGIKWPMCAKILGCVYIVVLWVIFTAIWRAAFKRVKKIRSRINQKQDKVAVGGLSAICAVTAVATAWLSKTILTVATELGRRWPEEPASVGRIALMIFFAVIWGCVVVSVGVSAHKCVHRGRRDDFANLLLSFLLAIAVSYVSWSLVPSF